MSKLTLSDLASLTNQTSAITTINSNNAAIEAALDNTLSRDGTSPNTMATNLDMNSYKILNLPYPGSNTEPVRLGDLNAFAENLISFPSSATDNAVVRFDGTSGKAVQNSLVTITDTGSINLTQTASGTFPSGSVMGWLLNDQSTGGPVTQFNLQHTLTGTLWSGQHASVGITAYLNSDPATGTTFSNILPFQTNSFGNVPVTVSKNVDVFGANWYVSIAAGATGYHAAVGQEIDVGISSTGSATSRIGLQIIGVYPQNPVGGDTGKRGTVNDIAYFLDASSSATSWAVGYSWGAAGFNSTSTILGSPSPTNANIGIDFSQVTFTGAAFKSSNFQINADGSFTSANQIISGDLDVTDGTSRLRLIGAGGVNFIESGNAAFNASANLSITGYLGNSLSTLSLVASTVNMSGALSVASSINKVTVTAPATSAIITMADGSTLVTSGAHSLTLTTSANSIVTFPTAGTLSTLTGTEALSNKAITASTLDSSIIGGVTPAAGGFTTVTASSAYKVGANQVVAARDTGWGAMTGTPDKATAFATSTVTLAQLAGRVMAMQTALTTHGLLGA